MAATKEEIKELAEHIYDLDAEVYVHLGSSLGRVFNRDRERCVNELTELLTTRPQGHLVRSELGLIANMARTIEDKEERAMCMTEYNRILQHSIPRDIREARMTCAARRKSRQISHIRSR